MAQNIKLFQQKTRTAKEVKKRGRGGCHKCLRSLKESTGLGKVGGGCTTTGARSVRRAGKRIVHFLFQVWGKGLWNQSFSNSETGLASFVYLTFLNQHHYFPCKNLWQIALKLTQQCFDMYCLLKMRAALRLKHTNWRDAWERTSTIVKMHFF